MITVTIPHLVQCDIEVDVESGSISKLLVAGVDLSDFGQLEDALLEQIGRANFAQRVSKKVEALQDFTKAFQPARRKALA